MQPFYFHCSYNSDSYDLLPLVAGLCKSNGIENVYFYSYSRYFVF